MQPAKIIDLSCIKETWTHFIKTGKVLPEMDPLITASWLRSAPSLNPVSQPQWTYLSDDVLPLTLNQHASLRRIARPLMDDIHQFIEGSGAMLILSDSTNCVLELLGDTDIMGYADTLGLRQGAFLDESRLGTNALAVALIEGCPAYVVGPEHFLT